MTDQIPDASVFDSIDPALKVVTAEIEISAPAEAVFDLIADPQRQPEWDGNDNLGTAVEGQRVRGTGGSFITTLTKGVDRENHIVDFEEGRLIAWQPSEVEGRAFRTEVGVADRTDRRRLSPRSPYLRLDEAARSAAPVSGAVDDGGESARLTEEAQTARRTLSRSPSLTIEDPSGRVTSAKRRPNA